MANQVDQSVDRLKEYIRQYEEGLITVHEMVGAMTSHILIIRSLPDQGIDGLPPNDILPTGERA